jgi:hypothetical protein
MKRWQLQGLLLIVMSIILLPGIGIGQAGKEKKKGDAGPPPVVPPLKGTSETIKLFNGKDLEGWDGYKDLWAVKDGAIVGQHKDPLKFSTYLFTKRSFTDFRLIFSAKIDLDKMHSGVALWGKKFVPMGVKDAGAEKAEHTYQGHLVMFPSGWGLFDLYRRNGLALPKGMREAEMSAAKKDWNDWNDMEILAQGNRIRLAVNGKAVLDWRDPDPTKVGEGPIALQLHSNKAPQEVYFKGLELTTFPEDKLVTVK